MTNPPIRRALVLVIAATFLLASGAAPILAAGGGARIEGLLVGADGRPATGHVVHLIDAQGVAVARSAAADDGVYRFRDLDAGEYSMGIESPAGAMAPVDAAPLRVEPSQLARRDVKLLQTDPSAPQQAAAGNYAVGMWWAGLSTAAKAWTIVGTVVVIGITVAALSDSDSEAAASPF